MNGGTNKRIIKTWGGIPTRRSIWKGMLPEARRIVAVNRLMGGYKLRPQELDPLEHFPGGNVVRAINDLLMYSDPSPYIHTRFYMEPYGKNGTALVLEDLND